MHNKLSITSITVTKKLVGVEVDRHQHTASHTNFQNNSKQKAIAR